MDTIRCPVCGAPNPENLERCRACNQLLKQSTSELNGFGELISSGQTPTEKKTSELEKTLPAWLQRARQIDQSDQEEEEQSIPEEAPAEPEEAPVFPDFFAEAEDEEADADDDINPIDWLAGLAGSAEDEEDEEEAADWLINLQGDLAPEEPEPAPEVKPITANLPPAPDEAPEDDGELPEWISNLQGDSAPAIDEMPDLTPAESSFPADDEGGLPDWLSRLSEEAEASAGTPAPTPAPAPQADATPSTGDAEAALPDWMAALQSVGEVSNEDFPAPSQADWLSRSDDAQTPAAVEGDLPGWMANLREAEVTPTSADDLPDWMSALKGADGTPAIEAASDDLPDWMSGDEPASEVVEPAATPADDLPDWMSALKSADEPPAIEAASDDLPDWLSGDEPASEVVEPAATPADDLPDWMSALKGADETDTAALQEDIFETEASLQEGVSPFGDLSVAEEGDLPDWLSRMGKPDTGFPEGVDLGRSEESSPVFDFGDDAPAWLDALPAIDDIAAEPEELEPALSSSPAFVGDAEEGNEIFGIEMPDWLSSIGPEDAISASEDNGVEISAENADLSGAELPSWVQAMRPVESVVSNASSLRDADGERAVASTGPLAGMSGILPVGIGMGSKKKPRAYAIKLDVNESQQSGAALLEEILASEAESAQLRAVDQPKSIPLLRWLIAALMIVILTASLLTKEDVVPSPNVVIPEVGAAVNIINQLPSEGTALLVFDYEAGLSAEMQAAGAPLVDHLMLRGQKLALLSTSPNGSALAELFLKTQSQHHYQPGEQYVNLGYLPGGASGMLSFVSSPRAAVGSSWDQPPLVNISRLTDFSVVVVLTDDVEKGRTWIEQASATLNTASTPFLMTISAQAEPIIYPYYASTQLDGLVSGISGGATYERLQGQSGLGRKYWNAYSAGLLIAEILIVVGAILNFLAGLRARQKTEKEEE